MRLFSLGVHVTPLGQVVLLLSKGLSRYTWRTAAGIMAGLESLSWED